ncbi:carbohydrate ABC transporter permease [Brachybacterium sp. AOP24-D1-21]|uniref:carbohydrate ABC transporter permease n=1 Tax=Brachybacterium sp. AOP24-D1-21 TaxID=3457711 RepID=UPI004033A618
MTADSQIGRPTGHTVSGGAPGFSGWANRHMKWLFALPALLFTIVMVVFPAIYTLIMSLMDASGSLQRGFGFIGLANYVEVFTGLDRFWPAVWRTLYFTVICVGVEFLLGLAIALLLRRPFRGQGFVRVVILLPLVATPVAVAMMWLLLFEPTIGFVNTFIGWFGLPPQGWISSPTQAMPTLMFVDIWQWTPMVTLILLAGLSSLPEEPEEAALIDRANFFQRLRFVVMPQLMPVVITAVLLRSIDALKTFDLLYATKGRGGGSFHEAETLNILSYSLFFEYNEYGIASAVLVVFFLLIVGASWALFRFAQSGDRG